VALFPMLATVSGCAANEEKFPPPEREARVSIDLADEPAATVSDRFLSFAVDTVQVVGGEFWDPEGGSSMSGSVKVPPYDFARAKLRRMARELAPAVLRIGGTAADETYYDLSDAPVATPPEGYTWVMTRAQWDGVGAFAEDLGLRILFTLNAGHGPRDDSGAWTPDNARQLIQYTRQQGFPVDVWELGNEVNGYLLMLKLSVDEEAYTADLQRARQLLDVEDPEAKLAGPSCAYWPEVGDFIGFYDRFMKVGGSELDLVTWHYYPQQSIRCVARTRPAKPTTMLQPENLDEVATWAQMVEQAAGLYAKGAPIWLGETGNAQCGGEPGISDAFVGGFWWLDQLGQLARRGHQVVIRQNLSGSDYGLIDEASLEPNPDYWNSLLWKRLMGPRVLQLGQKGDPLLRAYAHCRAAGQGSAGGQITALVLNLDTERPVRVSFSGINGPAKVYRLTADGLQARQLRLNGTLLRAAPDGTPPDLEQLASENAEALVDLEPISYAFVVLIGVDAPACR
jgi:heparanase 1